MANPKVVKMNDVSLNNSRFLNQVCFNRLGTTLLYLDAKLARRLYQYNLTRDD